MSIVNQVYIIYTPGFNIVETTKVETTKVETTGAKKTAQLRINPSAACIKIEEICRASTCNRSCIGATELVNQLVKLTL